MKEAKRHFNEFGKSNCLSRWLPCGGNHRFPICYLSCLGLARPLGRTSEKLPCPSPSGELRPKHEGSEGACNRQFCKLGTPEALCRAVRPGDDDRWRGRPPLSSYPLSSSISKHRSPMWEGKSFHFPDRLSSTNCLK